LVDDNLQVRDLTQAILERLGYTVLAAENAREALEVLARHDGRVNLVLSDVVMPGMNGPQLLAKISESHPGLKSLLMSGYTDDVVLAHAALGREVHFLQKPFTVAALARGVREALDA
jgi:two-component system cell cycle sensor histidine kinase/response regulator CckA